MPASPRLLVIFSAILLFAATAAAQTTVQARPADQFVDSMGINVHMEYANSPYNNYDAVNAALRALGMRHFRDEINDTDSRFVRELQHIGQLGYSLCGLIEGGNDYPRHGTRLDPDAVVSIIQKLLPTIDAVEGPNEPDGGGFVYDHVPYPRGAIHEAEDLWSIVKSSPELSFLPVISLSEGNAQDFVRLAKNTRVPIDFATYGNMHAYQGGFVGDHNLTNFYMPLSRDLIFRTGPSTTEMGYHNNTRYLGGGQQQGVSQRASAIYLPTAFLSEFNHGILRTFSYELIDEFSDPTFQSAEGHFGILNHDRSPKPAYIALQNLIAILQERGTEDFAPGSLGITFSGMLPTLRYTLLEKSSGTYYLAVWNDISVYRIATQSTSGADLYPQNVPITVTFSEARPLAVYAPNDATGTQPTRTYTISTAEHSITINLPPQVLLIKVRSDN